ncbi:hypothetical protein [Cyanothece sp. BG0011]|uniref:hypothetical protein n=1 Tax=Cyanothece sp. BG0011 TaxID=2082950 RepID=UPI000D1E0A32|nr:hypothetical protein [Cyanothece sp. BG0011]
MLTSVCFFLCESYFEVVAHGFNMVLDLTDIYGSSAEFSAADPTDPLIIIHLKDFQNSDNNGDITDGTGFDDVSTITSENINSKAAQSFAGQLKLIRQNQPSSNTDETNGIYITNDPNASKNFVLRNGVRQISYPFNVAVYAPDPTSFIDIDNVL